GASVGNRWPVGPSARFAGAGGVVRYDLRRPGPSYPDDREQESDNGQYRTDDFEGGVIRHEAAANGPEALECPEDSDDDEHDADNGNQPVPHHPPHTGQASRAVARAAASRTTPHDRERSARSSGSRKRAASSAMVSPVVSVTMPVTATVRRRRILAGVLRCRCPADIAIAAAATSTGATASLPASAT